MVNDSNCLYDYILGLWDGLMLLDFIRGLWVNWMGYMDMILYGYCMVMIGYYLIDY